ncbi:MAG: hypothetical protein EXQ96_06040 [Alphaproteobacteria bacterium]|nr:hypothetical protein [Alphaproteobacteria bacterium]
MTMTVVSPALSAASHPAVTALLLAGGVVMGTAVLALFGDSLRAGFGDWWQSAVLPVFLDAQLGGLHLCL